MPCWKTEFLRVLQMIRSAHWTTTMLTKKAVWHVNSTTFLCSYVCKSHAQRAGCRQCGCSLAPSLAPKLPSAPRAEWGLCLNGASQGLGDVLPLRLNAPREEPGDVQGRRKVSGDLGHQPGTRDHPWRGGEWEEVKDPVGLQRRQTPVNCEGTDRGGEEAAKASCLVVRSMASGHQAHNGLG